VASLLLRDLKKSGYVFSAEGFGGPLLKSTGMKLFEDASYKASIGVVPTLESIKDYFQRKNWVKDNLKSLKNMDMILLVDNQGVHIPLARAIASAGLRVVYYLPPHVSIFAGWNARKLAHPLIHLATPMVEDYRLYRKKDANAFLIQHPLLPVNKPVLRKRSRGPLLAGLFPGSRSKEIDRIAPLFKEVVKKIKDRYSIFVSHPSFEPRLRKVFGKSNRLEYFSMKRADSQKKKLDYAVVASGTVSLELTLRAIPHVVVYYVDPITYLMGKIFLKTDTITLANMLVGKNWIPEIIRIRRRPGPILVEVKKIKDEKKLFLSLSVKLRKALEHKGMLPVEFFRHFLSRTL